MIFHGKSSVKLFSCIYSERSGVDELVTDDPVPVIYNIKACWPWEAPDTGQCSSISHGINSVAIFRWVKSEVHQTETAVWWSNGFLKFYHIVLIISLFDIASLSAMSVLNYFSTQDGQIKIFNMHAFAGMFKS